MKIFIGYDSREDIAFEVARASILEHIDAEVLALRLDDRPFRILVEKADADRFGCIGLECANAAIWSELLTRVEAARLRPACPQSLAACQEPAACRAWLAVLRRKALMPVSRSIQPVFSTPPTVGPGSNTPTAAPSLRRFTQMRPRSFQPPVKA